MPYKDREKLNKYRREYQQRPEVKAKRKKYLQKNKDLFKIKRKKYQENNKDKIRDYQKEYCQINKDKKKEYDKEYQEKNKSKLRAQSKEYRQKNKDKIKEKKKEYSQKNKDSLKIKWKEYREKNKKAICIICGKLAPELFCSPRCMGIGFSGSRHHNWKGGRSFEPYPINWTNRFKRQIRKRDGYLCAICNRHQDEFNRSHDVHHIDGDKMNTTEKNCISLCHRHHSIVENGGKKYTFWMPKFQKMLNKLYGYKYN